MITAPVRRQGMRTHVVTLFLSFCATVVHAASKWPDHEWLIGSTGVAWSNPEVSGANPHMEMWFVFFGSEFYVHLPMMPPLAFFLALSALYVLWVCRHRLSRRSPCPR